jgi:hypothetical protein
LREFPVQSRALVNLPRGKQALHKIKFASPRWRGI